MQKMLSGVAEIRSLLLAHGASSVMLVCDGAFSKLVASGAIKKEIAPKVVFDAVEPNPRYEDVCEGARAFVANGCDFIVAVGGGSTMDTAKCIKHFYAMDPSKNYLEQEYVKNGVPLLAVPTTAGTGSEATRFAVIYYNGEKQSITNGDILPSYVLLEPALLKSLPLYQKKCAMLDALCQALESWWSVHSTGESRAFSILSIKEILKHKEGCLSNTDEGNRRMLMASHLAGRAINITQTTAPHAMSYKLTSLYRLPHGHAVALCLPHVWRYMLGHIGECCDPRGEKYVSSLFFHIAAAFGLPDPLSAIHYFEDLLKELSITPPKETRASDLELLARSVNPLRLKNNPVPIDAAGAKELYRNILSVEEKEHEAG